MYLSAVLSFEIKSKQKKIAIMYELESLSHKNNDLFVKKLLSLFGRNNLNPWRDLLPSFWPSLKNIRVSNLTTI